MALLDPEHLADLPGPVLRALSHSGVLEREVPRVVTLTQYGRIRSARDARWMRFTAEERYRLAQPDFEWRATVRALGLPVLKAVDRLEGGHGNMRGRLLGMMTLFDETGPHMDQGSLVRWLNETMWFPGCGRPAS